MDEFDQMIAEFMEDKQRNVASADVLDRNKVIGDISEMINHRLLSKEPTSLAVLGMWAAQHLAQEVNPGNTIASTAAWQADGQINFETLYGKSKYWKQLNQRFSSRGQRKSFSILFTEQGTDVELALLEECRIREITTVVPGTAGSAGQ